MNFDQHVYAVILAGGSGTRFWPKSRQKTPKQLCKLGGAEKTMLELTLERLDGVIPPERRMIVTHIDQAEDTKKIAGKNCAMVIAEPDARNTANALALAALEIQLKDDSKNAVMISLHADHVIRDVKSFVKNLEEAVTVSRAGKLTLLGIVPEYAETGYGYIEMGEALDFSFEARKVKSFKEKPNLEVAKEYVASKKFLWNGGMFVFPIGMFVDELRKQLPLTVEALMELRGNVGFSKVDSKKFAECYKRLVKISVDNAVLETSSNIAVVPANIGWKDVGSWDVLGPTFGVDGQGNYVSGDCLVLDSRNCVVESDGPLIATLGVEDLIVVHARNAIMVCPKNRAQDVKVIVEKLKEMKRENLT